MGRLIGSRLLAVIPMLIGLSIISFLLIHLSPVDPARLILGGEASEEAAAEIRAIWRDGVTRSSGGIGRAWTTSCGS